MDLLSPEFRERLKRLRLAVERVAVGGAPGHRLSRERGHGIEFFGHRPYSPGDDPRYLDWNAVGRLDQLILKQFETPGELTLALVPDCSPTMRFGDPDKFTHAAALAAAIGFIALHGSDRATVAPLDSRATQPRHYTSAATAAQLVDDIGALTSENATSNVKAWLHRMTFKRGNTLVVLLTDFLNRNDLLELLDDLRRRQVRALVLHIVAPQEYEPPLQGRTRLAFADPAGGGLKTDITPKVVEAYGKELRNYLDAVASACRRAGAGYLEVSTATSPEAIVLALVAHNVLRAAR